MPVLLRQPHARTSVPPPRPCPRPVAGDSDVHLEIFRQNLNVKPRQIISSSLFLPGPEFTTWLFLRGDGCSLQSSSRLAGLSSRLSVLLTRPWRCRQQRQQLQTPSLKSAPGQQSWLGGYKPSAARSAEPAEPPSSALLLLTKQPARVGRRADQSYQLQPLRLVGGGSRGCLGPG